MKALQYVMLSAALMLAGQSLLAQEKASFPGIEALMSEHEYQAAGIDKLTAAERDALNRWLVRYTAEDSQVLLNTDEQVKQAVAEQETLAIIQQPFDGWSGDTIFRLDNGQVWQQRRRGNYRYMGSRPQVRISRNIMGFYRMELVENGKSVQVKRIK